jgi:hypothetical protein
MFLGYSAFLKGIIRFVKIFEDFEGFLGYEIIFKDEFIKKKLLFQVNI